MSCGTEKNFEKKKLISRFENSNAGENKNEQSQENQTTNVPRHTKVVRASVQQIAGFNLFDTGLQRLDGFRIMQLKSSSSTTFLFPFIFRN